jgi:hypothetical protein
MDDYGLVNWYLRVSCLVGLHIDHAKPNKHYPLDRKCVHTYVHTDRNSKLIGEAIESIALIEQSVILFFCRIPKCRTTKF